MEEIEINNNIKAFLEHINDLEEEIDIKAFFEHMDDLEKEVKDASYIHIQNLIFVPQGCNYFLDTAADQQHTGLITQGAGPCVCIIVRNRDNTKMVLAHVDSGNDITDEEFGLPKWVRQCGDGNNVIVEVHIGCGQTEIKGQDNPKEFEPAILGFERTIQKLQQGLHFVYNGHDQSPGSQGGIILRNRYSMVIDETGAGQSKPWNRTISHKILQNPKNKNGRTILNEQISFNERLTDKIYKQIKEPISKPIKDIINNTKNNIPRYIEDTSKPLNNAKADSAFCQEHNIKVPLIPLDEITNFKNGLTEEFKKRIDNQSYIKSRIKEQKKEELQKQQEQEKEFKQQEQLKEEELKQEQQPEQLEEENHININNRRQELIKQEEERKSEDVYIDRQDYWQNYIMERQKLSEETLKNIK